MALHTGNNITIGYDDEGHGIPLLLIHGFPHNRTLWAPQLSGLGAHARCIAPDLRGFGDSDAVPPFSMDQYADDLAGLLDGLGIASITVGGLSMGGYAAFAFWRRHRDRVRALILADTRAGADTEEGKAKRRDLIELAHREGSPAVADAQLDGMIGKTTRAQNPDVAVTMRAMMAGATEAGVVGALEAMMQRPDSSELLPSIDVPTLIIVGEEDVLTPVKDARAMHAAIAGSRLEILEKAGHVSNIERPAAFNHVVGDFLDSLAYS
jgi:3-oxoadipate enol-lactonase